MSFYFLFSIFYFLLGLAVGSFLNSVIYRLHSGESFLKGFSHCPHCKHRLDWKDLIPLLSFIILKGKCRYCHQKISFQYPLVELTTGILFLFPLLFPHLYLTSDRLLNMNELLFYWVSSCFLIIIFVYDLKHYIIPDKIIYPAIVITFLYQFLKSLEFENWNLFGIWDLPACAGGEFGILKPILSALFASIFFLMIVIFSRGKWMGMGDVKLAFFMGLFLGFPNILAALFLAFFIGAIIGLGLIISGKKKLSSEVPFGPFLVSGTFLALFLGQDIIDWYINLFL